MKSRSIFLIFLFASLTLLLSACSGGMATTSWPGYSVQDDRVYLAYQGGVFAVRLDNGNLVWRYPEKADNRRNFYAAPQFVDGQVITGDYAAMLSSLDSQNGSEKWTFNATGARFISKVTVVDDVILAPASDHYLYAFDSQGGLRWKFETDSANWSNAASDGETVYLASLDHSLYAIDLKSGEEVWKTDVGGAVVGGIQLNEEKLYLGTLANEVLAVDKKNGEIDWRFATAGAVWATPILHEGVLYFGDITSSIYAVDTETVKTIWRMSDVGGPIVGSAGIYEKGLIFVTESGKVVAVDFNGSRLWQKEINGKLYSSPIISDDRILLGINDGDSVLKAFDFNGNEIWSFAIPK